MLARPHPRARRRSRRMRAQRRYWHNRPPGNIAGKYRLFCAQHLLAHGRVNAIGTDQHIARYLPPVSQPYLNGVFGLVVAVNIGFSEAPRHLLAPGAVNMQIWRAPAIDGVLGQWNLKQFQPRTSHACFNGLRPEGCFGQLPVQPQRGEHFHRIGWDLNRSTSAP